LQESGFGGLQTYPGEQPQSASLPVSCGVTGAVLDGAAQVVICEMVTLLSIMMGDGDGVVSGGFVAPIIEAIITAIPPVVVEDDTVLCTAGAVLAGKAVTVGPGLATVTVCAGIANVVIKILVMPGWVDITVVPACVNVVRIPGRLVVMVEVMVEAGITRVVPWLVTVRPEPVIVVPGSVTISPGPVIVVPGRVIVVKDPKIDVVIVLASWVTTTSEVTVMASSVNVVGTIMSDIDIEVVVTIKAGSVMIVRAPEIDVVIVEAGTMTVVGIIRVDTN
jgi:hypothetical protein